jgi:hypothetical protein
LVSDSSKETHGDRLELACERLLNGPLTVIVGLLCVGQYVSWIPIYVTWPWWADLDVFGTAALAWDRGISPYRDFLGNNFPGTIYVCWILGKVFGWGYSPAVLGFDALLVGLFGLLLAAWSRRVFGSRLPGLIGYGTFLGYYLDLDYTQVAQRDWQGPFFAVAAILFVQGWRSRWAIAISALCMAFAVAIRPQTVLFLPALLVALVDGSRSDDWRVSPARALGRGLLWSVICAAGLAALALPLVRAGVASDFLRSLRIVAPGSRYNTLTPAHFFSEMILQLLPLRILIAPLGILLLWKREPSTVGPDPARAWLAAFAGVLFYRPLSPQFHAYLSHPINLTWAILVALLIARIQERTELKSPPRLLAVLLAAGMLMSAKPRFSDPAQSLDAMFSLMKHERESVFHPEGYQHNPLVRASARYEWEDYRALLLYIRRELPPEVRVANALKYVPAVNGVTGRSPVFPAESIAWLAVVHRADEPKFAEALRRSPDSVVVWAPSEKKGRSLYDLLELTKTIEELYEPDRRFGPIEVWKRKAQADQSPGTKTDPDVSPS